MASNNGGVTVIIAGQDDTGKIFEQIDANLKRTANRAHETESALASLGEGLKKSLEIAGIGIGLREAFESLKSAVETAGEFGEKMQMASTRTGLSVQTLSTLHYAADLAHTDFDGLAVAVGKLGGSLAAAAGGDKALSSVFHQLGIDAKDLAGREDGVEIALKRVAEVMSSTESPAQRLRLAKQLLGKAGQELIPVLMDVGKNFNELKEGAEKAGVSITALQAEKLAKLDDDLDKMKEAAKGAALSFTSSLAPALDEIFRLISNGPSLSEWLKGEGDAFGRDIASTTSELYSLAAAYHTARSMSDWTAESRAEQQNLALQADTKAQDAGYFAAHGEHRKSASDFISDSSSDLISQADSSRKTKPVGYVDEGDLDKLRAAREKFYDSLRKLREAQSELAITEAKADADRMLAVMKDQHDRLLLSDEDYASASLSLQTSLVQRQIELQQEKSAAIDKQISDLGKLPPSDPAEVQLRKAKLNDLETERAKIVGNIYTLESKILQMETEAGTAAEQRAKSRLALNDEMAAKLEQSAGGSVEERIKQANDAYYGGRNELDGLFKGRRGEIEEQGGNVDLADRQHDQEIARVRIAGTEQDYEVNQQVRDAQTRRDEYMRRLGLMSNSDVRASKMQSGFAQADDLEKQVKALEALGDGDAGANAKIQELKEQIYELRNPIDEVTNAMREGFDGAFEGLFTDLDQGTRSLENFARSVERTLSQAVYQQYIEPAVQKFTASVVPNQQKSVSASAINAITDAGAGITPGIRDVGKQNNRITITLLNESGMPLKIGNTQTSGMSDKDKFDAYLLDSISTGGILPQFVKGLLG